MQPAPAPRGEDHGEPYFVPRAFDATITALASDYASAAGGNPTISCFDELWACTSERSRRLWDEMITSPARRISCRLTVTYAGFEGESTLLEELYRRGLQQPLVGTDLHAGDGLLFFWSHTPVAPWQDERWLSEMRRSLRPAQFLRMIENRFVTTELTFIDMAWWDACVDPAATPTVLDKSLPVCVGVDASVKRAHWDRKTKKARLIWHRIFQPSSVRPARLRGRHRRHVARPAQALPRQENPLRPLPNAGECTAPDATPRRKVGFSMSSKTT